MKILQLTDLHLSYGKKDYSFGQDAEVNFELALQIIKSEDADLIVITGDLCLDEGEPDTYRYILQQLKDLNIPFIAIPGNHDNPEMMLQHFSHQHCFIETKSIVLNDTFDALFINSADGSLSTASLKKIATHIDETEKPLLVFIHHPVFPVDVPHMEKNYSLKNREMLLDLLQARETAAYIFCGHYHVDITSVEQGVIQQITPSLYYQIKPGKALFEPDTLPPAYRTLLLQGNTLHSRVVPVVQKNATNKNE